jgi:C_GCAxxG_C_C family probable redox protein
MSDIERAVELFKGGCACSQAVLGTYGPRFGLSEDMCVRVAAGFASGMRRGETCGAVTGALMVLGLAHCNDSCRKGEGRKDAYGTVVAFSEKFEKRHGSLRCSDLLGCDMATPEGQRLATERGLFRTKCVELVHDAAEIVEGFLPKA